MRPADFRLGSWAPVAAVWQCVQNAPFQTKYTFQSHGPGFTKYRGNWIGLRSEVVTPWGKDDLLANTRNGLVVIVEEMKANKVRYL